VKLLFDQNLSHWLPANLGDCFPGCAHVREFAFRQAPDSKIWDFAAENGFAIVTKDSDFRQRSFLEGHPPKVLWVGLGNCSTKSIAALLRNRAQEIAGFLANEQQSFLVLS
jgi:predicted nuclease of predicted toxin-antitoxin system